MTNETTAAAERVRRLLNGESVLAVYGGGVKGSVQYTVDRKDLSDALALQQPTYADLLERLAEIDRLAKADADDLAKMRDGTKLTRYGLVEIIAYQQQEIAEARAECEKEKREHLATQELHERSMRMIEDAIGPTRALHDGWRAEASAKAIASIVSQLADCIERLAEAKAQAAAFADAIVPTEEWLIETLGDGTDHHYYGRTWTFANGFGIQFQNGGCWLIDQAWKSIAKIFTRGQLRHLLTALAIAAPGTSQ
jgi:hypothetical protein